MDSTKWKCKNWIEYFKKIDNFQLFHLIVEKLEVLNFHAICFYWHHSFHTQVRDLNTFFKNIHQKWKYYRKENQDFKRFLIYLNIKMSAKSRKN